MSRASLIRAIVIVGLMSVLLVSSPSMASNPRAVKGPEGNSLDSIPTVSIENAYLKVYSSSGGRFVNGTTGDIMEI